MRLQMTEEKRVESLENAVHELATQVGSLEKQMSNLSIEISRDAVDRKNFEATLRNIDDSLNALVLKFTALPMERHSDIQRFIDPVWEQLRQHDKKFKDCGDEVKVDIRKEAKSHVVIIWLSLILVSSMCLYIVKDAESDIITDVRENKNLIKQHIQISSGGTP